MVECEHCAVSPYNKELDHIEDRPGHLFCMCSARSHSFWCAFRNKIRDGIRWSALARILSCRGGDCSSNSSSRNLRCRTAQRSYVVFLVHLRRLVLGKESPLVLPTLFCLSARTSALLLLRLFA